MSNLIQLFNPTPAWMAGEPEMPQTNSTTARLTSATQVEAAASRLAGMVVGFIDNAKPNFRFLCALEQPHSERSALRPSRPPKNGNSVWHCQ